VYEDAPHGFLNNTMLKRYRHPQSEAAWQVQMAFLEKAFAGKLLGEYIFQRYEARLTAGG
jgi:hypothetical protein